MLGSKPTVHIVESEKQHPRYGYHRLTALLYHELAGTQWKTKQKWGNVLNL
jgi:hypothetical protein